MEWILYSDVGGLYLSGKDSGSNPYETTQVSLSLYMCVFVCARVRGGMLLRC